MIFTTSDGIALYYEKSGTGVPCLFLHGGPGYWSKSFQVFAGPLLEDNLEMVYIDQRGCGRSGHSVDKNYTLTRLIEDIEEWRQYAGINEMYVMGHSFGGILAVSYANKYPDCIKAIILSNVTLNMLESFEHQVKKGNELLGLENQELQKDNIDVFMNHIFALTSKLVEKELYYKLQFNNLKNKELLDQIDKEEIQSDSHFQKEVFSSEEYFQDFTILSDHLNIPALVIAGESDHSVGPEHHLSFRFPNITTKLLNSSHHPYLEDSINFRNTILNFLQATMVFSKK